MNNLRAAIDTLFRKLSPQEIIKNYYGIGTKHSSSNIDKEAFVNQAFYHLMEYSHNEVQNVLQKVNEDWGCDDEDNGTQPRSSVFNLLNTFAKDVLVESNNEPQVEYEHLLRWRELSYLLGEDIFITSYFANKDIIEGQIRRHFGWRVILPTNNLCLKKMLDKGLAENHFHLMGSAPHFNITWLSIMNVIAGRSKQFKDFESKGKFEANTVFSYNESNNDLYTQCIKAASIRLFLFEKLKGIENTKFTYKDLREILQGGKEETRYRLPDIQNEIDVYKRLYSCKLHQIKKYAYADYAIPADVNFSNANGNVILVGERKFMYDMFSAIKSKSEIDKYQDLFYAYLVIKAQMREELIQVCKNTGFTNFQRYERRKVAFMFWDNDIYSEALVKMAVSASSKNQSIRSIEARITPKDTISELLEYINKVDTTISSYSLEEKEDDLCKILDSPTENEYECFYNIHFIKKKDKRKFSSKFEFCKNSIIPRDYKLRNDIKRQAQVLAALRNGLYEKSKRIYGIDAASSEIDARPEVFAQLFRFLKTHKIDSDKQLLLVDSKIPQLGSTFHAGEDFLDVVDGMRAIDEAIKFLNLGQGDRIGHALALGINVKDYYEFKSYTLMKPKQVHLDDIVWMLSRISKYGLYDYLDVVSQLKREYCILFQEIYCFKGKGDIIDHEIYYEAWKLRGDSPSLYDDGKFIRKSSLTFWERCGYNDAYPKKKNIRDIKQISKLYHDYHFNSNVKKNGDEMKHVKISKRYAKVVALVQKYMQKEVAAKHLAIETNPSSNVLIGSFSRYDKHPLMNFYNLGLETDPEKIKACPQLFVSINTDDQGVFSTYLENEYALMALALEKVEDEDGNKVYNTSMIYDWLDRIRQMGLEMSFKSQIRKCPIDCVNRILK